MADGTFVYYVEIDNNTRKMKRPEGYERFVKQRTAPFEAPCIRATYCKSREEFEKLLIDLNKTEERYLPNERYTYTELQDH